MLGCRAVVRCGEVERFDCVSEVGRVKFGVNCGRRRRLETGENRSDFSSFEEVINQIVRESAIQGLIDDKGCDRDRAEELAEYMLQGYSPW